MDSRTDRPEQWGEKSDASGPPPKHLSEPDPHCCWLRLLITDSGTQTHTCRAVSPGPFAGNEPLSFRRSSHTPFCFLRGATSNSLSLPSTPLLITCCQGMREQAGPRHKCAPGEREREREMISVKNKS